MNERALDPDVIARNFQNVTPRSASRDFTPAQSGDKPLDGSRFRRQISLISGPLLGQSPLRAPGFGGAIAAKLRIKSPARLFTGGTR